MTLDPAVRYNIHKIERHLDQLVEFGLFDKQQAEDYVIQACADRNIDYETYLEGHWSR